MRCCHGNGLDPKIDNQNISLISTVSMLVNLHGENVKGNKLSFVFLLAFCQDDVRDNSREPP